MLWIQRTPRKNWSGNGTSTNLQLWTLLLKPCAVLVRTVQTCLITFNYPFPATPASGVRPCCKVRHGWLIYHAKFWGLRKWLLCLLPNGMVCLLHKNHVRKCMIYFNMYIYICRYFHVSMIIYDVTRWSVSYMQLCDCHMGVLWWGCRTTLHV